MPYSRTKHLRTCWSHRGCLPPVIVVPGYFGTSGTYACIHTKMVIQTSPRWVMMNNANLDKSEGNRKSLAELRSELKKWEEERMEPKRVVEDTAAHEVSSFVLS